MQRARNNGQDLRDRAQRQQVCRIPMDRIELRRDGGRGYEDSDMLNALAASISRDGLVQAITVRPLADGRYVIESGNRRFRACRMAGMREIDAVVLPARAENDTARTLLERLVREPGDFLDQATRIRELQEAYGVPLCLVAERLGESEQDVAERMRLTELDPETRGLIRRGHLPERVARALLRVAVPGQRAEIAERAVREELSAGEVEMLVTSMRTRIPARPEVHGQTIGAVRDGRLYLNALRSIAAQMRDAGFPAEITETTQGRTLTLSVSVSTRRRRSGRRQSRYSQAVQCVSYMSHSPTG